MTRLALLSCLMLSGLALTATGCGGSQKPCYMVSGAEAKKLLVPGTILIDARPRGTPTTGQLPGAVAIPRAEFSYRLKMLDPRSRLVVFAETEDSAREAAEELRGYGFQVYELGTLADWSSTETKCHS